MSDPQQKKKGMGCCGTGCVILILLVVGVGALAGFGFYKFTQDARQYTADSKAAVPVEDGTPQEYDALVKKMDAFKDFLPGSDSTLSITAHDLNVLIARSPQWSLAAGKIHATIANGQVGLAGSIPLSAIPTLRDQYLNGAIYFTPTIDAKVFHATIQGVKSDTRELPKKYRQAIVAGIEPQLNNRLLGDPVIGAVLIKAETLKVEGNALVLTSAK